MNRRDFLKAAVLAGAGGTLSAAGRGMFVSMRNLNGFWEGYGNPWNFQWQEFFQVASRAGYGGIDFNTPVLTAVMKEKPEKVRAVMSGLKLRPGFVYPTTNPFARDEAAYQASLKTFDELCGFLAAVGFDRMMTTMPTSYAIPKEEMRKIALDRARAMGEIMGRHKLHMGIENLSPLHFRTQFRFPFPYSVPDTLAFCKEAGPNWGLCLDAWHWHHAGGTPRDILDAGKERVLVVHIEDARQQPPEEVRDSLRLLPGEGVIDLSGFLEALKKIGYEGQIGPEPLSRFPLIFTPDEVARLTLDATLAVLKKAGIKPV